MIVDRVARAMTDGAPRAGFTARVMAPIHGRPQPGFTARVMAGLDAPRPHAGSRALRPAVVLAGVIATVAGAILVWPAGVAMPPAPGAPRIAARPYDRELIGIPPLPYNRWAPETPAPVTQRAAAAAPSGAPAVATADAGAAEEAFTDAVPIYRIEPLSPPRALGIASLAPPAATVARLPEVPPLRVSDLHFEKENQ